VKGGYALIVFLLTLSAYAQSPEQIKLVSGDYPPFTGESLPGGGLVSRLVRATFAEAFPEAEIKLAFEPWARGFANTENQRYLATFPYFRNEARAAVFNYSQPVIFIENVFYRQKSAKPASYDKKTICLPLGYAKGSLSELIAVYDMKLVRPATMLQCFKMLAQGRADLLACSKRVGQFFTGHYPQFRTLEVSPSGPGLLPVPLYVIFPKRSGQAIVTRFNLALEQLKRSGRYQELIDSYRALY